MHNVSLVVVLKCQIGFRLSAFRSIGVRKILMSNSQMLELILEVISTNATLQIKHIVLTNAEQIRYSKMPPDYTEHILPSKNWKTSAPIHYLRELRHSVQGS